MHKNGGIYCRWFCFFDKLKESSFVGNHDSSLQLGAYVEEREYIYICLYRKILPGNHQDFQ